MNRNNNETTKQFKEISPILESFIYCPRIIEEELSSFFQTKVIGEDKTFAGIFQNILKEIAKLQKKNLKKINAKTDEIEKFAAKNKELLLENQNLNEKLQEAQKTIDALSNNKRKHEAIDVKIIN